MAAEYVAHATSAGTGTADPRRVSKPAGTEPGDILLCMVAILQTEAIDPTTLPEGWTEIGAGANLYGSNQFDDFHIFYKVAGAAEPAHYDWNSNASDSASMVICAAYRGGNTDDPIDSTATHLIQAPSGVLSAAITLASENCLVVGFAACGQGTGLAWSDLSERHEVSEFGHRWGLADMMVEGDGLQDATGLTITAPGSDGMWHRLRLIALAAPVAAPVSGSGGSLCTILT